MRRNQDGRHRDDEQPRSGFLWEPARLDSERLAAHADQAPVEQQAGPDQRLASLFEPAAPGPAPAPAPPAAGRPLDAPRRRPRAWLLVVPAATLAVGLGLGFALGSAQAGGEPSSVTATGAAATRPPAAPVTSIVVRPTASSACLETAARADQLIALLVRNRRSAAADLLVAYTVASRQCRRDASP
jgi:anti-sigma factor RsiW